MWFCSIELCDFLALMSHDSLVIEFYSLCFSHHIGFWLNAECAKVERFLIVKHLESSCFMTISLRMLHGFYDNKFRYAPMFPSNSKHSQYYGMVMFVIGVISSLRYYKPLIWVSLKLPPQLQTYRGYFGNFVISFEIFW